MAVEAGSDPGLTWHWKRPSSSNITGRICSEKVPERRKSIFSISLSIILYLSDKSFENLISSRGNDETRKKSCTNCYVHKSQERDIFLYNKRNLSDEKCHVFKDNQDSRFHIKKKVAGKTARKSWESRWGVEFSADGRKDIFFLLLLRSHKRSSDDGWLVLYRDKENTWPTESKKRAQVTFEFHVTGKKPLPRDEKIQKCTFTNNR